MLMLGWFCQTFSSVFPEYSQIEWMNSVFYQIRLGLNLWINPEHLIASIKRAFHPHTKPMYFTSLFWGLLMHYTFPFNLQKQGIIFACKFVFSRRAFPRSFLEFTTWTNSSAQAIYYLNLYLWQSWHLFYQLTYGIALLFFWAGCILEGKPQSDFHHR